MGQCVMRDCGLDQSKNTTQLQEYLKKHLQEKYFDNFLETQEKKTGNSLVKDQDFVSSLEFPPIVSTLGSNQEKNCTAEFAFAKPKKEISPLESNTKIVFPLKHDDNEENTSKVKQRFTNENYKSIASENAFDEDFFKGSVDYKTTKINKFNENSHVNTYNEHSIQMFQNQIFENVNTTPSGVLYRSDDEKLSEYEKIFQDDEFNDSFEEGDYVKKIAKEN